MKQRNGMSAGRYRFYFLRPPVKVDYQTVKADKSEKYIDLHLTGGVKFHLRVWGYQRKFWVAKQRG